MERPILFSTPMVQAILAGRKTQTRRVVKLQALVMDNGFINTTAMTETHWRKMNKTLPESVGVTFFCPYGQPGDTLWVRETWAWSCDANLTTKTCPQYTCDKCKYYLLDYKANAGQDWVNDREIVKWKPSIHMPRQASRISLLVKSIRVERLQDITEEDAKAEGFTSLLCSCKGQAYACTDCMNTGVLEPAELGFMETWEAIYNKRGYGWEVNPWVWVIEFERIT